MKNLKTLGLSVFALALLAVMAIGFTGCSADEIQREINTTAMMIPSGAYALNHMEVNSVIYYQNGAITAAGTSGGLVVDDVNIYVQANNLILKSVITSDSVTSFYYYHYNGKIIPYFPVTAAGTDNLQSYDDYKMTFDSNTNVITITVEALKIVMKFKLAA